MIRSDSEYKDGLRRTLAERQSLADHEAKLRAMGLSDEQVAAGMAPLRTFHRQFAEEVEQYARIKNRDFSGLDGLRDLGRILIAARIASGMRRRALAHKLGVDESQVSRDERNEYNSITVERACAVLEALDVEVRVECKLPPIRYEVLQDYNPTRPAATRYSPIEFHPGMGAQPPSPPDPRMAA